MELTLREKKVDGWMPKSIIKKATPTTEIIEVPKEHSMYKKPKLKGDTVRRHAIVKDNRIKITFPYSPEGVTNVKTLIGRTYHPDGKYWTCPIGIEAIEKLKDWNFKLDNELLDILTKSKIKISELPEMEVPGLKADLYPFQKDGIAFLEAKRGRALIADEMGLGKTVQSLAYLQLHPEKRPAVIVCPASLKLNWKREIRMWMSNHPGVEILSGKTTYELHKEIIIINYDILPAWLGTIKKIKPQVVITDECHYYKNNSANRTKAVKMLAKGIPHFIALSGTPIVNRPVEIFNSLHIIDPTVMPSFWTYAHRYCGARNNGFGWDFSGATNTQELHEKLTSTIMIRRKKKDVLKDLPDKSRSFTPFDLDNRNEYDEVEDNFIEFVRTTKGEEAAERASNAETLAQIEALKQIAVKGKLNNVIDWIKDFLNSDEKLVVYGIHKFVIDRLMEEFKNIAVKIDGSVSSKGRDEAIQQFQNNSSIRLFVGNIKAAGIGITLTASSNVVFLELPWTPGELVQAEDRCHRIGQKDSVNIYYLLADGTIEEEIARMLDRKRQVLDKVLDGEETDEESLLSELMKEYEK